MKVWTARAPYRFKAGGDVDARVKLLGFEQALVSGLELLALDVEAGKRKALPGSLLQVLVRGGNLAQPLAQRNRTRATFERVLWKRAAAQAGVTLRCGHVDRIEQDRGRAVGVTVDGRSVHAGLVIDASGRSSRFTDGIRPPAEGGDCGAVYVTRQYRLLDPGGTGPMNSPIALSLGLTGYWAIAFLQIAENTL